MRTMVTRGQMFHAIHPYIPELGYLSHEDESIADQQGVGPEKRPLGPLLYRREGKCRSGLRYASQLVRSEDSRRVEELPGA